MVARVEVNEVNEVKRVAVKAVMAEAVEAVGSATEVTVEAAMAETMEVMTALETAVGMAAEYTALNRVLERLEARERREQYLALVWVLREPSLQRKAMKRVPSLQIPSTKRNQTQSNGLLTIRGVCHWNHSE